MKAALGKNVKISLPKALQTSKEQIKSLAVKGVITDVMNDEFNEFLDLDKISYAKAEGLKSKKDGRALPMFRLEISEVTKSHPEGDDDIKFSIDLISQMNRGN